MKVYIPKAQNTDSDFEALLNCHENNKSNFSFLIRLMRRHVVIPFLGAGFSANFGYPGWKEFLSSLATSHHLPDVEQALEKHEFEKAASLLKEGLGGSIDYTLMQAFGDHKYKANSGIKELEELPRIFHSLLLTTNFDEVIEMLYAKVNHEYIEKLTPKSLKDVELSHKRIACGEPTLIKLHGDVAEREFVLTEQEYNEVYGKYALDLRLPLPAFLREVLLSRVILFLGCSLQDDRTLHVIEQSQIEGSISFALLPLPESTKNEKEPWNPILTDDNGNEKQELKERRIFLNSHSIIPIWYPSGEHEALKILLRAISYQISSETKLSDTVARDRLDRLVSDGAEFESNENITQAYNCYVSAMDIIKRHAHVFSEEEQLSILEKVRLFYNSNGYAFESVGIVRDIMILIRRIYSEDSIEMASCYHDIGYTYERYGYYELMQKAMERCYAILEKCKEKSGKNSKILNAEASIYISLAYAYLMNKNNEKAKEWYQKASRFLDLYGSSVDKARRAFLYNGLYRYYKLIDDDAAACQTLETALILRKELYHTNQSYDDIKRILIHILNTHSNKIDMYLKTGQIRRAKEEFTICANEYPIWHRTEYLRDSKRRILTDHGDILRKCNEFQAAYEEYKKALKYRKYLHVVDDFIAARIYLKIADSLTNMSDDVELECAEEALEYLIQAYVIFEIVLNTNHSDVREIRDNIVELGKRLSYGENTLEKRITAQKDLLQYRYDDRMRNRQAELITYFNL